MLLKKNSQIIDLKYKSVKTMSVNNKLMGTWTLSLLRLNDSSFLIELCVLINKASQFVKSAFIFLILFEPFVALSYNIITNIHHLFILKYHKTNLSC